MNKKEDIKNRIFDLTGFSSGNPNEKCTQLINLLDSGLTDEKNSLEELDTHWIVFLFECDEHLYGTLLVENKTSPEIILNLRTVLGKFFKRHFPRTAESNDSTISQCIEKSFPHILQKNVLGCIFQFD